jgi:hypothetical protein
MTKNIVLLCMLHGLGRGGTRILGEGQKLKECFLKDKKLILKSLSYL